MSHNGKPRLRLAHVSLGLDVGGQERLLVEFARHADRRRFDLVFVSLTSRGRLAPQLEALGWPVLALDTPPGLRPSLVLRLSRLFREQAIDVVHTHDDKPLVYGALAARLAHVSRIVHTHHHGFLPSVSRRQTFLLSLAARLTDAFVCVSQNAARFVIEHGVPESRVLTLWNGIDLERFPYHGAEPAGPALLVARLSPEKDVATLLHAVALVQRSAPEFRLEIAGDGPCRAELEELCRQFGLERCVYFLGEVSDVPALLRRASLFVLSSLTEGISLTILEAMASGLPVVTTKVGGNPEVVLDGATGRLVPSGDPAALAKALLQVWGNPDTAQLMGRAGRHRVESYFDIRRLVAQYERLYVKTAAVATPAVLANI